ncbi:zinc finger protein [Aphelenchoides avenae]|nr:zinc finger protein [Aphelenchus avenae]
MEQPMAEPSQKIPRVAKKTVLRNNSTGADDNRSLLKSFRCQVCGSETLTKNFGAYACRACAAFFRRAIACGRKYKCKALSSCSNFASPELREPPFCKSCRLRKCFLVGMSPLEIRPFSGRKLLAAGAEDDSLLGRTTRFRSVLFMQRLRILSREGADLMARRYQRATALTTVSANKAEIKLLRDFFSSTDAVWSYLRSDVSVDDVATHFFLVWYILENLLATTRNYGYRRSRVFSTDDTYFDTTVEGLERDFASLPIRNKDVAARQDVFHGFTEVMAMLEMYTPLQAPADLFVLVNSYRCRRDKHVLENK